MITIGKYVSWKGHKGKVVFYIECSGRVTMQFADGQELSTRVVNLDKDADGNPLCWED
jgi:hypothetical protein